MRLEPVEIQHVPLKRRLLGYHPGTVDRLLEDVTSSYEEVWLDREALRGLLKRLEEELERARERERLLGDVLLSAHRIAAQTVAESKEKAESLLAEARRKADEMVAEAQREPERLREEVRRLETIEHALHERYRAFLSVAHRLLEEGPEDVSKLAPLGTLRLPKRISNGEKPVPASEPLESLQGLS